MNVGLPSVRTDAFASTIVGGFNDKLIEPEADA